MRGDFEIPLLLSFFYLLDGAEANREVQASGVQVALYVASAATIRVRDHRHRGVHLSRPSQLSTSSVSGNTLFSDVSETQDDVPSLGELFFNLKCKVFIYFLS